jgi:3-deoxy-D-manno-octulosonic-acid transferase
MRLIYRLLLWLALPLIPLRLLWRARRQPEYLRHWGERLGRYSGESAARDAVPTLWLHAVSVGETRGAEPLVRALRAAHPRHRILLTHMTPTGRAAGEALFAADANIVRVYLPYDYPWAVRRFLRHFQPAAGMLMETEIWPNLVRACADGQVPLYLINARLSEKSFARYQRGGALIRETLKGLTGIAAQTQDDAARLRKLGARQVAVTGNLKFDVAQSPDLVARGAQMRRLWGARKVLLAASTRDGEEALLLDHKLHELPDTLLVIVPRHPQRFDEVAALLEARGITNLRRSAGQPVPDSVSVLLGDSMGELAAYYSACDVAFVGGSLLPFGGQNLIEACAAGKPVLVGPHTYNFGQAAELAVAAGAALRVQDAADLARKAHALLTHHEVTDRMSAAAKAFSDAHRGATKKILELVRFHRE